MDNKKTYKKIATFFWFMLAFAPIIYALSAVILQWFSHLPENTDIMLQNSDRLNTFYLNFFEYFDNALVSAGTLIPFWLGDWAEELCDNIQCSYSIGYFCAWFIWVYVVELICDIMVWLPRFAHNLLERSVNKID